MLRGTRYPTGKTGAVKNSRVDAIGDISHSGNGAESEEPLCDTIGPGRIYGYDRGIRQSPDESVQALQME